MSNTSDVYLLKIIILLLLIINLGFIRDLKLLYIYKCKCAWNFFRLHYIHTAMCIYNMCVCVQNIYHLIFITN